MTKVNAQGRVVFGATVQLVNVDSDEEVTYQIVGVDVLPPTAEIGLRLSTYTPAIMSVDSG